MPDDVGQMGGPQHPAAVHPCRFAPGGERAEQAARLACGGEGSGQGPRHRDQPALQRQLTQGDGLRQLVRWNDAKCCQQAKRDGQIKMRPLLRQIGGGEG